MVCCTGAGCKENQLFLNLVQKNWIIFTILVRLKPLCFDRKGKQYQHQKKTLLNNHPCLIVTVHLPFWMRRPQKLVLFFLYDTMTHNTIFRLLEWNVFVRNFIMLSLKKCRYISPSTKKSNESVNCLFWASMAVCTENEFFPKYSTLKFTFFGRNM